jgi:membrane protease YdiL (CAAX protease family)
MWLSIIVTSVIFSAIHLSWYGFIPRVGLGIVLGLLYAYSGNLWPSVIAHAFNNALVVTQIYYMQLKGKPLDDASVDAYPLWVSLLATVLLIGAFVLYKRISLANRRQKMSTLDLAREEKWLA